MAQVPTGVRLPRPLLIAIGGACTVIGFIGLVVPMMPGAPFLLLAAACFARTSPRCEAWLLRTPLAGPLISEFRDHGGITTRQRWSALAVLWLSLAASAWVIWPPVWWLGLALVVGAGFATTVICRVPASRRR